MASIRAVLIALTVFITATFPILVREIGPSSGDGTVYANWGAKQFLLAADDNNNQAPPEIVVITATPAPPPPTATRPPATPIPPPAAVVAPPPLPAAAPPPPPPAAAVAAAPAQAPRQLPKTGEAEFGLYGLAALGALLVLGAAGIVARRRRA